MIFLTNNTITQMGKTNLIGILEPATFGFNSIISSGAIWFILAGIIIIIVAIVIAIKKRKNKKENK